MMRYSSLLLRVATILVALAAAWPSPASSEISDIAARQCVEKKSFTDAEIVEGFLKTTIGAEYQLPRRVDRIRSYDGPVRMFAEGGRADRKAQLAKVVADTGQRVQ